MKKEANYGLLAVGQVYKGYAELCRKLGVPVRQSGSGSQIAQFNEWARYFEFEEYKIEGRKRNGIIITKVYDTPLLSSMKNTKYADIIRSIILTMLYESDDGCIRWTTSQRLLGTGLINENYNKVQYLKKEEKRIFLKENHISLRTFSDFFDRNKNVFRGYFNTAYKFLEQDKIINPILTLYVVKFKDSAEHHFLEKDDALNANLDDIRSSLLKNKYKVRNEWMLSEPRKVEFFSDLNNALKEINYPISSDIEFVYQYNLIEAINKNEIPYKTELINIDEATKELNMKHVDEIIKQAKADSEDKNNFIAKEKYDEIIRIMKEDEDTYKSMNEEKFWKKYFEKDTDTEDFDLRYVLFDEDKLEEFLKRMRQIGIKSTKTIEEELMPNANKARPEYFEEIQKLVDKVIRLDE